MRHSICTELAIVALLLLGHTLLFSQDEKPAKDASIWVVDDTHKVNPLSGNLLSEGLEIYQGGVPSTLQYRKQNAIWDIAAGRIKLIAGRNEFVSFQLVIEKGRQDLHKIFVTCTDLIGARERISADSHIRLFKELYLKLDGVWYPDALLPFELAGTTPFHLPDYEIFPEQKVQAVWGDIYVPH